ncbi:MAG: O-antigen ligase family protein [Shewanella algae]
MEVMQESFIGRNCLRLWTMLLLWCDSSVLRLAMEKRRGGEHPSLQGSALVRCLTRTGVLSRSYERSLLYRLLSAMLNLPGRLLGSLYLRFQMIWDRSVAARVSFAVVENTPIVVGWLMLVILVIPYRQWNNAYSLVGFALLLGFAMASGMRCASRRLDVIAVGPYAIFFAGFVILAWIWSYSSAMSQRFVLYHLACMLCVLVVVSTVERRDQLLRLAGASTGGLLLISAYAVVQRIQGVTVNPSFVDLAVNKGMPGRVYSVFENPNAFGEVLVLLIPVAVGLMFAARGWLGRLFGLLGAGLGTVALVMTYSRAGWVGLLMAALLFVFLWNRKLLPVVILLGVAAIPFLPDTVLNRILTIFNMNDTSTSSRFPLYEAAMNLIRQEPFTGAGLGSDAVRAVVKEGNLYHGTSPFVHSHNVYLQMWAETGLFGLLALLGTVGYAIKQAGRVALGKGGSYPVRLLTIGGASAIFGIMICGFADFIWHYPRVMLVFWFVFALTIAGVRLALREEASTQNRQGLEEGKELSEI